MKKIINSRPKIGVDIGHADYLIPSRQIGLDLISFKSTCAKKKFPMLSIEPTLSLKLLIGVQPPIIGLNEQNRLVHV
jgi:hypothetical protein